ncbi:hypothetical protein ACHQI3_17315 [Raoultella planticola]|uniref:hypothetical protein n=1 Tax=Raoultella planticola TaxID=575 RepID=UPI003981E966
MSKKTGGQAFPRQQWEYDGQNNVLQYQEEGMTLRDYFASKALGLCYADYLNYAAENGVQEGWRDGVAKDAYLMADAMLKAREGA